MSGVVCQESTQGHSAEEKLSISSLTHLIHNTLLK